MMGVERRSVPPGCRTAERDRLLHYQQHRDARDGPRGTAEAERSEPGVFREEGFAPGHPAR